MLTRLQRYEEALSSYNDALEEAPDEPKIHYDKAGTHALLSQTDLALEHLQKAVQLSPDPYRDLASTNPEFDSLRENSQFQELIQNEL